MKFLYTGAWFIRNLLDADEVHQATQSSNQQTQSADNTLIRNDTDFALSLSLVVMLVITAVFSVIFNKVAFFIDHTTKLSYLYGLSRLGSILFEVMASFYFVV